MSAKTICFLSRVAYTEVKRSQYRTDEAFINSPGKIVALDPGSRWVGVAISDASRSIAQPLTTIVAQSLFAELHKILTRERPTLILVGHPITMRGAASAQTVAVEKQFEALKKQFPVYTWLLWDERLTSYGAQVLMRDPGTKTRHSEHAIAATCLLESYLAHLRTPPQDS